MPSFHVLLFLSLFSFILAPLLSGPVKAETMNSNSYTVRTGNFNITSGLKSSGSYTLTDTVGSTVAEYFHSTGYHVKAGFQYLYTLYDFSFSLSSLAVSLALVPNTFSNASHTLTVTAPGQGYAVSTYATSRLKLQGSATYLPDTLCDAGPCTESDADIWTNPSNNGFGYNVAGADASTDFVTTDYFRPFPDLSLGDSPAVLLSTVEAGKNRTATLTYRLSSPGDQAAGTYNTDIIYIATPTY